MTERIKNLLAAYAIPLLALAFALGAAQYQLQRKEDTSSHEADIQRVEAKQSADVQRQDAKMDEFYSLLLDMRCEQKPDDRRCK